MAIIVFGVGGASTEFLYMALSAFLRSVCLNKPIVEFKGKKYILLHRYSTDFCEIQDMVCRYSILLVHSSEVSFDRD